ncbi:helix-turn-helix transcriptional regulator [Streptomyces sp. SID10815]|uniref:helix-turn-helix domain-containing protein n=1 Tax=Streptomyces sp. SID10815 TaxID=2706027 RepID=UPI001EF362C2|nr:helix-turn-helix transcriptional regulator [Streptomyces sp. SID10815]
MKKRNFSSMKMLGAQVQAARKAAGHTQQQLASLLNVDVETIASIEQGRRPLMPDFASRMDDFLGCMGMLSAGVAKLPDIDQYPMYAEQYMVHEREAVALSFYANQALPGLLQTSEYAYAVLRQRVPAYDKDEIEVKAAGRIERQQILHRKSPPTLSFVIWEPVLRIAVGGREVRRQQLHHLRECAELPGVTLQFLPLDSPSHAGLDGPFVLVETPDHQHLAYTEGQRGSQWVSDPDEMSIMARKYAMLRTQALTTHLSLGLLDRLLGDQ